MPTRRFFLAASLPTTLALTHGVGLAQDAGSFGSFLKGVKAEARRSGISATTVDRAFASVSGPNHKVLDRYRHQPEFTMTWARYRGLLVTDKRITDGRAAFAISNDRVRFHDFATLFRDRLQCRNALFLDGSISSLYSPEIRRHDRRAVMGTIIAVVKNLPW